jgi:hypothetical protein
VTCLLSFTRCLACFGGPVKDGTRDQTSSWRTVQAALLHLECEIGGQGPIAYRRRQMRDEGAVRGTADRTRGQSRRQE